VDEDVQLLQAVGTGDEAAIERLYDLFAGRIYGFGLRLLGDGGLAEELVQETFIRLWAQASRFDPSKASARTFIFTVARRLAIDLFRRPSSRPLRLETEAAVPNPADEVVTSVVVRDALATLSAKHREVLELLHFQQLTQTEAASVMRCPVGTLKARSYHAVRALRAALEERGVDA
jgi:RNA polymerase sigma-70 factor (ECF subfamily)